MHKYLLSRHQKLLTVLQNQKINGLLVTNPSHLTYLTGVYPLTHRHREAYLLITAHQSILLVSPLRQSHFSHLKHFRISPLSAQNHLSTYINQLLPPGSKLAIDPNDLHVAELDQIKSKIETKIIKPKSDPIQELRLVKDDWEIDQIRKACRITAQTWQKIKPLIKPGLTEKQIAFKIIETQINLGAEGVPKGFDPIVAAGSNSAVPHHITSDNIIRANDVVLVDYGCTINGYASDFTRTIKLGKPTLVFQKIESLVQQAHRIGLTILSKLSNTQKIDQAVRDVFQNHKQLDRFIHTTGHGLGLDIHEPPTLYHLSDQATQLQPGMVITIEPGLYFPGQFGYRYEDTVLVTEKEYEILTET